jgi:hypothetical protein
MCNEKLLAVSETYTAVMFLYISFFYNVHKHFQFDN